MLQLSLYINLKEFGVSMGFPHKVSKLDWSKFHPSAKLSGGTVVYKYWTNFSRASPRQFEVLTEDPKIPGFWSFQTNLAPDDFDHLMTLEAQRSFLYKMVDIYRSPAETG